LGVVDVAAIAERGSGERHHAPELAAAEDAYRASGRDHQSVGVSPTAAVRAARQSCSRCDSASSASARIEAARMPALVAPASPIASAPVGTPAGICTIDSRLSSPDSAFDCTGTPSTGRWVSEESMPGRCAAPPAPAMTTLKPSPAAPRPKAYIRSGVRCAETIRASYATP